MTGALPKLILAALPLLVAVAPAQEFPQPPLSTEKRFNLYTGCAPLRIVPEFSEIAVARPTGLSEMKVREAVTLRLREADLIGDGPHALAVGAAVVGESVTLWVRFRKVLKDPITGHVGAGTTWHRLSGGPSVGRTDSVLKALDQMLDAFLEDYLSVNEEACEKRS